MATCSINPYHGIADESKRDAIVKILALLNEEEQPESALIKHSGAGSRSEHILGELRMFGLIQPSVRDGFFALTDRGAYALNEMK
ncbi:hypothetical protein [Citrobacter sp. Marseille-Q6884]|uniref:hypothetical protein n=1 Tax=Citrobacter sp. Marseille-Q6884 TaxID=2956786 RepID=UPI0021B323FD|nr:hypothetical protein [Citrobacter sp. Marseille-Q6884]HDX6584123.1 hypothetical protein [Escherichia coli]